MYPTSDAAKINSGISAFTSNMPLLNSDHELWSLLQTNFTLYYTTMPSADWEEHRSNPSTADAVTVQMWSVGETAC